MTKIALILPPRPYLTNQKALPNLGILTVASVAKQLGCQVEVIDLGVEKWVQKLMQVPIEKDTIYGMYASTPDYKVCLGIMKYLKAAGGHKIKVIAGGPHCSFAPQECLKDGFDAVSVGNAEVTLPQILKGEKIAHGWLNSTIEAAHPDRTIIDLTKYNFKVDGKQATSMMTASGCLWGKCAFCSRPSSDFLRYHSLPWVLEEIKQITNLGFQAIQIYDDEFFTYPKRDIEIIKALGEQGITWRCFGHSKFLHEPMIKEAYKNGLREILIGVESGSDKILTTINKGTTVILNKITIKMLHQEGIKVKAAMIIGLPSESPKTLKETWKFCDEMTPYVSDWDFTVFSPYPGSDIYDRPNQFDIKFEKGNYTAFKGSAQPDWNRSQVSTSKLTNVQILRFRDRIAETFKKTQA